MKLDVMEKWTAALESGEFKQARGRLSKGDGSYCCLGVLCELFHREVGDGRWFGQSFSIEGKLNASYLPAEVRDWAGLKTVRGDCRNLAFPSLASMNDNADATFTTLASVIRQNAENL